MKVLINEWGYSSAGGLQTPGGTAGARAHLPEHKWRNAWGAGHTPEVQADYVRRAHEVFLEKRDILMGAFFYRWEDQATCWQCGKADCPVETAWGIVDTQNQPKPAYWTFKEGVAKLIG